MGVPFIGHGNPDNNLESLCISETLRFENSICHSEFVDCILSNFLFTYGMHCFPEFKFLVTQLLLPSVTFIQKV
jgi:hypothetical protein